jgi:hypothetical protein
MQATTHTPSLDIPTRTRRGAGLLLVHAAALAAQTPQTRGRRKAGACAARVHVCDTHSHTLEVTPEGRRLRGTGVHRQHTLAHTAARAAARTPGAERDGDAARRGPHLAAAAAAGASATSAASGLHALPRQRRNTGPAAVRASGGRHALHVHACCVWGTRRARPATPPSRTSPAKCVPAGNRLSMTYAMYAGRQSRRRVAAYAAAAPRRVIESVRVIAGALDRHVQGAAGPCSSRNPPSRRTASASSLAASRRVCRAAATD